MITKPPANQLGQTSLLISSLFVACHELVTLRAQLFRRFRARLQSGRFAMSFVGLSSTLVCVVGLPGLSVVDGRQTAPKCQRVSSRCLVQGRSIP